MVPTSEPPTAMALVGKRPQGRAGWATQLAAVTLAVLAFGGSAQGSMPVLGWAGATDAM